MFTAVYLDKFENGDRKISKHNTFDEALNFLKTEAVEREAWYCQIIDDISGKFWTQCISNLFLKGVTDKITGF